MRPQNIKNQINEKEPEELKVLSKTKIYQQLAEKYLIPNPKSRAITRDYLIGVFTGKYFRVSLSDIHKFNADITPRHMKKALYVNIAETVQKVDAILREAKQAQLGFTMNYMPDTVWLYQVARFVDPCNATGIFKCPVRYPINSTMNSDKVLMAQQAAEKALLEDYGILGKRHIMDSLQEMCNVQKQLSCRQRELDCVEKKRVSLVDKIKADKVEVENRLEATTVIVLSEINQTIEREISRGSEEEERRRVMRVKET